MAARRCLQQLSKCERLGGLPSANGKSWLQVAKETAADVSDAKPEKCVDTVRKLMEALRMHTGYALDTAVMCTDLLSQGFPDSSSSRRVERMLSQFVSRIPARNICKHLYEIICTCLTQHCDNLTPLCRKMAFRCVRFQLPGVLCQKSTTFRMQIAKSLCMSSSRIQKTRSSFNLRGLSRGPASPRYPVLCLSFQTPPPHPTSDVAPAEEERKTVCVAVGNVPRLLTLAATIYQEVPSHLYTFKSWMIAFQERAVEIYDDVVKKVQTQPYMDANIIRFCTRITTAKCWHKWRGFYCFVTRTQVS